jgi:WD40 repeat protein
MYNEENDQYIGVTSGDPDQPKVWTDAAMVKVYHASLALLLEFQAHKSTICTAVFNNERQELVTSGGGYDTILRVWNVVLSEGDGQDVTMTQRGVINSTEDSIDVLHRKDNLLFGASGTEVWMWDQETLDTIRMVQLDGGDLNALCYSTESNVLHTGSVEGEIASWDLDQQEPKKIRMCQAHNGQVNDLWLEQGTGLFSCGDDGKVFQWDVNKIDTNCELGQYKFDLSLQTKYHPAAANLVAVPRKLFVQHIDVPACHRELLFVFAGGLITLLEIHSPQRDFAKVHDMVVAMAVSSSGMDANVGSATASGRAGNSPEIVVLAQNSTLQVLDPGK